MLKLVLIASGSVVMDAACPMLDLVLLPGQALIL